MLVFKNHNAYYIDKIKDEVTWKICLTFQNIQIQHQMQGSITYVIKK
jgi:hypothetical protein